MVSTSDSPHEIVELNVLDSLRNNITPDLDHYCPADPRVGKTRHKRDISKVDNLQNVTVNFPWHKQSVNLVLNKLRRTVSRGATLEWFSRNRTSVKPLNTACLFEGSAPDDADIVGVFSLCNGFVSSLCYFVGSTNLSLARSLETRRQCSNWEPNSSGGTEQGDRQARRFVRNPGRTWWFDGVD